MLGILQKDCYLCADFRFQVMEWLENLFLGSGIAHSVMIVALTIALGLLLGRVKIGSISLGVTWVLFVGILLSHLGFGIDAQICNFVKEFGLILFVYSIGIQVGPGFVSSLREGGLRLNLLAVTTILLGVVTCYVIHRVTGEELTTMVGVLSGAVTNTPGLGAAQQTVFDVTGEVDNTLASAYAVSYPLGVVGIIVSMLIVRAMFRIRLEREAVKAERSDAPRTLRVDVRVTNPAMFGRRIDEVARITRSKFVVGRIFDHNHQQRMASGETELQENDILRIVVSSADVELVQSLIGEKVKVNDSEWQAASESKQLEKRRIVVTKPKLNGRHIGDLHIRENYNVTITRVVRAGIELVATYELRLQMGDVVVVVGHKHDLDEVANILGNSVKRLDRPNLLQMFIGIFIGVLVGSIPIVFPGIPQPVKLGLAGGPLIVAILLARYGARYKLITFTTNSANMMIREIGISLFLAAVGLGAGEGFVESIAAGGYWWILYGVLITVLPLLVVGFIARKACKFDYFTIMGLMSGAMTDPPALAYANSLSSNDRSAVAYASVYPLTMFLRIFTAQILVLVALS